LLGVKAGRRNGFAHSGKTRLRISVASPASTRSLGPKVDNAILCAEFGRLVSRAAAGWVKDWSPALLGPTCLSSRQYVAVAMRLGDLWTCPMLSSGNCTVVIHLPALAWGCPNPVFFFFSFWVTERKGEKKLFHGRMKGRSWRGMGIADDSGPIPSRFPPSQSSRGKPPSSLQLCNNNPAVRFFGNQRPSGSVV